MFVKIDYSEMSKTEFDEKIKFSKQKIKELNEDSKKLDDEINKTLEKLIMIFNDSKFNKT